MTSLRALKLCLGAAAAGLGAVGCPVLLSDDFHDVPADSRDASQGNSPGSGGSSSTGGQSDGDASSIAPSGGTTGVIGAGGNATGGNTPQGGSPQDGGTGGSALSTAHDGGVDSGAATGWSEAAAPDAAFVAREQSAYTAFDTRVFIWGGADGVGKELRTGALYDVEANRWTAVAADANTPSARVLATAVWTGAAVVVWGGGDHASLTDYATGGRYDPATNSWSTITTSGAPSARRAPFGVWTGSHVLFWGGISATGLPLGGAYSYDPVANTWSTASTTGEPVPPLNPTVGWTGTELIVYGGRSGGTDYTGHADAYDTSLNAWHHCATGPQARMGAFGAWDGTSLIAWGGTSSSVKKDGQRYMLASDTWSNMVNPGAPGARYAVLRQTGWSARVTDATTLIIAGLDASQSPLTDGALYDSVANTWTPIAAWPSGAAHLWGVAAWAGSQFVVWGGRVGPLGALTTVGERFRP